MPGCSAPDAGTGVCAGHAREERSLFELESVPLDPPETGPIPIVLCGDCGSRYGRAVLARSCERVCQAGGGRHVTLLRQAINVGGFVGGGEIEPGYAAWALLEAALAVKLPRPEAERVIQRGLRMGAARPLTA